MDVNMAGTWMLCGSAGRDGVCVDVRMVGTWTLNGWSLCGRQYGWDKDALWERMESVWMLSWLGHGGKGSTAKTVGFGTAGKANAVNTESFGTCRIPEFGRAGTTDGTDIFGT